MIARTGKCLGLACLRKHVLRELEPLGRNLRAKVGLNHLQRHLVLAPLVRASLSLGLCRSSSTCGGQSAARVDGLQHGGTQPRATHTGGSVEPVRIEISGRDPLFVELESES